MAVAKSFGPRYGAITGFRRVMGASVVVDKGFEGESSGKIKEKINKKI